MPPPDVASTTPSQTSGRRLMSHFTSPFKAKSRNVADFHITVDDPHRQYSPGDEVRGSVHLRCNKPIRITHLVVVLHGFVQVYKNPNSPPAEGYRANNVGSGRGVRSGEYFGNGFASLFEDEVVLCGDGRLKEGAYQFNFLLLFPDSDLPSSISFERGTISYMITATLTRPTAISPTIQADHKVYMVERIDISQLLPPKPRTITLEPISRRTRAKTQARKLVDGERKSRKGDSNPQSSGRRGSQTSSSPSLQAVGADNLHSPAQSEISFESLVSQGIASQQESNATSPRASDAGQTNTSKGSVTNRTITATVEQLTGGCLRGDTIPIHIHITHTKYVKSLHGVIITLYRQARVDMHPAIPIGPTEKGKEAKYEDYYPRSVTGLGGLSLSGAGSSHVFRKDLAQTTVPLIIDPTTLIADLNGKVQVPDEAFPTISTVPGAMISFRYYVEVVLDVQGKLGTQDRSLGNLGGLTNNMTQGCTMGTERERSAFNQYGAPVIDTAAVRRDKGVVACTFEVIVGTKDTQRRPKGKQKVQVEVPAEPEREEATQQQHPCEHENEDAQAGAAHGPNGYDYWYDQGYDADSYAQNGYTNGYGEYHGHDGHGPYAYYNQPPPAPLPQIEDESHLSEKERARRAEERLLPSQPDGPEEYAGSSSQVPTAPYIPEEQLNGHGSAVNGSLPILLTPPSVVAGPIRNILTSISFDFATNMPLPRTPEYEPRGNLLVLSPAHLPRTPDYEPPESDMYLTPSRSRTVPSTDDKEELRRRQLEQKASAPPDEDDAEVGASQAQVPTAPALNEHDELYTDLNDSHAEAFGSNDLPRYER